MPVFVPKPKRPEYKRKMTSTNGVKFEKLSLGTLRRYQYFFKLDKNKNYPKFIESKE